MSNQKQIREFIFDVDKTCKMKWTFAISQTDQGPVIDDIEILPHTTSNGTERGCVGHPKTIISLIKGRPLNTLDIQALLQTSCLREISCGQALGQCLADIRDSNHQDASIPEYFAAGI